MSEDNRPKGILSWISRHPFVNIILWSIAAIAAFAFFFIILGGFKLKQFTPDTTSVKSLFASIQDAVNYKLVNKAIAMLSIIPATGALVLKYQDELRNRANEKRKQADEERKNRDERRGEFSAALERMSSNNSAMSRLAGVHTLVDVSDRYQDLNYLDETVSILCAYLRSDHSEDDPVIESVVLEKLQKHYAKDVTKDAHLSWSNCPLDLHGATIRNPFNFDNCIFNGTVNLDDVTFEQSFQLTNCNVKEITMMDTVFHKDPLIRDSDISGPWNIRLSESSAKKLTAVNGKTGEIRLFSTSLSLLFNCEVALINVQERERVESINVKNGSIKSINVGYRGTIRLINAEDPGSIKSINMERRGTIRLINVGYYGSIESINMKRYGLIKSISVNSGTIKSINTNGGTIESINMEDHGFIGSINVEHHGLIESIKANSGTIKSVNANSGTIESININIGTTESINVNGGTIESINVNDGIQSTSIQKDERILSYETFTNIGTLIIYNGHVGRVKMTGGVIYEFHLFSSDGINELDLSGGKIALLIKPQDFEIDAQNQSRVIKTVSLMKAITA